LSRTNKKDYENFVINAIWNKLNNDEIEIVSQQYISNNDPKSKYKHYFIDLYFPGLNIGIECDEAHHHGQKEHDKIREATIYDLLHEVREDDYEAIHIDVTKSFKDLQIDINNAVNYIKQKIEKTKGSKWNIETAEEYYKNRNEITIHDRKGFKTINQTCNILFNAGRNEYSNGPTQTYFTPRVFHGTEFENHKMWFPRIAIPVKDENGNVEYIAATETGWNNQLTDEGREIIEKNDKKELENNHDRKTRIVFAKYKDSLGDNAYKFVGMFELSKIDKNGTRHYKRTAEKCKLLK
jgi:very-short-patch-repair endonuclease